jgi:hypothetical protein
VDEICDVDITAPDAEWLAAFTRSLAEDGLAASANLIAPVQSGTQQGRSAAATLPACPAQSVPSDRSWGRADSKATSS